MRVTIFITYLVLITITLHGQTDLKETEFIISNHLKAIGGEENWKKLDKVELTYSLTEGDFQLTKILSYDKMIGLREDNIAVGRDKQIAKRSLLYRNDTAIQTILNLDKIDIVPINKKTAINQLQELEFLSPFIDYKNKTRTINYQGTEHVKGVDYYKFIMYYPSGRAEYIYINPSTFFIEKTYLSSSIYEAFQINSEFKKYKLNLFFPTKIKTEKGTYLLEKVRINEEISKTLFDPELFSKENFTNN